MTSSEQKKTLTRIIADLERDIMAVQACGLKEAASLLGMAQLHMRLLVADISEEELELLQFVAESQICAS
jgi:hypothetical protein